MYEASVIDEASLMYEADLIDWAPAAGRVQFNLVGEQYLVGTTNKCTL